MDTMRRVISLGQIPCGKVVPTEYKYLSREVLPTNQFSVTEYFSPMNEFDRTWPAVYFLYDFVTNYRDHQRRTTQFSPLHNSALCDYRTQGYICCNRNAGSALINQMLEVYSDKFSEEF